MIMLHVLQLILKDKKKQTKKTKDNQIINHYLYTITFFHIKGIYCGK